jgi:hypothetical protein
MWPSHSERSSPRVQEAALFLLSKLLETSARLRGIDAEVLGADPSN